MGCCLSWGFLLLVMCLVHSMFLSCSGCLMEERAALMDIRSLLMSAQSEVPNSWGHSDDCCTWEGITCNNGTRRISGLKLSNIYRPIHAAVGNGCWNMNLAIFSSLRELQLLDFAGNLACLPNFEGLHGLSKLKYLDLSYNSLLGDIRGSVGKLLSLEVINLNRTGLSWALQNTGQLPADFSSIFPNLMILDVSRNVISGTIPPLMCNIGSLEYMDLSNNKLTGEVPFCLFTDCSALNVLKLPNNSLEDPHDYGLNWPATSGFYFGLYLDGIYLSYHGQYVLQGFTFTTKGNPYTYGRNFFMSMSGIDLSANMLSGEIPQEIGNLSHTKSLNLSNNFFTGSIPATFSNLNEIESLDLKTS